MTTHDNISNADVVEPIDTHTGPPDTSDTTSAYSMASADGPPAAAVQPVRERGPNVFDSQILERADTHRSARRPPDLMGDGRPTPAGQTSWATGSTNPKAVPEPDMNKA